jgi:Icc-related predicted phosphoesterase
MNILAIADLHCYTLNEIDNLFRVNKNNIDVIVWLGDNDNYVIKKMKQKYNDIPHIGILGNYETYDNLTKNHIENIDKIKTEINGISFVGLSGCCKNNNKNFRYGYTQKDSIITTLMMPKADIIISHTSPMGIHISKNDDFHCGLIGISDYIKLHSPRLCIHGHQHINKNTLLKNGTLVIGVFGATIIDTDSLQSIKIF